MINNMNGNKTIVKNNNTKKIKKKKNNVTKKLNNKNQKINIKKKEDNINNKKNKMSNDTINTIEYINNQNNNKNNNNKNKNNYKNKKNNYKNKNINESRSTRNYDKDNINLFPRMPSRAFNQGHLLQSHRCCLQRQTTCLQPSPPAPCHPCFRLKFPPEATTCPSELSSPLAMNCSQPEFGCLCCDLCAGQPLNSFGKPFPRGCQQKPRNCLQYVESLFPCCEYVPVIEEDCRPKPMNFSKIDRPPPCCINTGECQSQDDEESSSSKDSEKKLKMFCIKKKCKKKNKKNYCFCAPKCCTSQPSCNPSCSPSCNPCCPRCCPPSCSPSFPPCCQPRCCCKSCCSPSKCCCAPNCCLTSRPSILSPQCSLGCCGGGGCRDSKCCHCCCCNRGCCDEGCCDGFCCDCCCCDGCCFRGDMGGNIEDGLGDASLDKLLNLLMEKYLNKTCQPKVTWTDEKKVECRNISSSETKVSVQEEAKDIKEKKQKEVVGGKKSKKEETEEEKKQRREKKIRERKKKNEEKKNEKRMYEKKMKKENERKKKNEEKNINGEKKIKKKKKEEKKKKKKKKKKKTEKKIYIEERNVNSLYEHIKNLKAMIKLQEMQETKKINPKSFKEEASDSGKKPEKRSILKNLPFFEELPGMACPKALENVPDLGQNQQIAALYRKHIDGMYRKSLNKLLKRSKSLRKNLNSLKEGREKKEKSKSLVKKEPKKTKEKLHTDSDEIKSESSDKESFRMTHDSKDRNSRKFYDSEDKISKILHGSKNRSSKAFRGFKDSTFKTLESSGDSSDSSSEDTSKHNEFVKKFLSETYKEKPASFMERKKSQKKVALLPSIERSVDFVDLFNSRLKIEKSTPMDSMGSKGNGTLLGDRGKRFEGLKSGGLDAYRTNYVSGYKPSLNERWGLRNTRKKQDSILSHKVSSLYRIKRGLSRDFFGRREPKTIRQRNSIIPKRPINRQLELKPKKEEHCEEKQMLQENFLQTMHDLNNGGKIVVDMCDVLSNYFDK